MMTGWEPGLAGWNKRLHAGMLSKPNARYERAVAQHKQRLLGALVGDVLEIGPGGGTNLTSDLKTIRERGLSS